MYPIERRNYLFLKSCVMSKADAGIFRLPVAIVATRQYVFCFPFRSGPFGTITELIHEHELFRGVSTVDGIRNIIFQSVTINQLEQLLNGLLNNDPRFVHKVTGDLPSGIRGLFGRYHLFVGEGAGKVRLRPEGSGTSRLLRTFYKQ